MLNPPGIARWSTPHFHYQAAELCCDGVSLTRLAAEHNTPLYVYSANAIRANYRRLATAFTQLRPLICYAVKANFNLSVLRVLKDEGAGFDIVSGGELHRVLTIGGDPARVVFAGVGKTDAEMDAALQARVGWLNAESADELSRLNALAGIRGRVTRVALRLNPDVQPDTHPHIRVGGGSSKFGLPADEVLALAKSWERFPALDLRGIHVHIGSQMADPGSILCALDVALDIISQIPRLEVLDIGGGFPVPYRETELYPSIESFAAPILAKLAPCVARLGFHLEPGRYLVANAGVLVTTVQAVKRTSRGRTVVVDTGMHHLLRPALYGAYHRVVPLIDMPPMDAPCDVVGPICESTDVLAWDRHLPAVRPGDRLAIMEAGAYGFSMASQYNSHPRPAEVLVDGGLARRVRRRETPDDMLALEREEG